MKKERTTTDDLISRANAIEAVGSANPKDIEYHYYKHIAVDALESQPSAEPQGDLISRQDALKPFCTSPDGTRIPEVDCDNFPVEFSVEFIKKHLLSLSSADAEWIPCSERLPEKGEVVLITNGKGNVRCGQYRSEHDVRNGTHYWWWKGKTVETVLAWMPLPEPYRKESEVGE